MILKSTFTNQFEKDLKLCKKRNKDLEKLKNVIALLVEGNPLPAKQKDHKLIGNFKARRECHIEPDWLLIYKIEDELIIFERTGSHSDLFS